MIYINDNFLGQGLLGRVVESCIKFISMVYMPDDVTECVAAVAMQISRLQSDID